jgi:hypothetical protein
LLKQATAICQSCGVEFPPKRSWQGYCSAACTNRHRQKRRRRAQKCRDSQPAVSQPTEWRDSAPSLPPRAPQPIVANTPPPAESYGWGKPGDPPLLGDDYPLTYDANGYPELPTCLDRRSPSHLRQEIICG